MILTPAEYEHARTCLLEARARQAQRKERLTSAGHTPEELDLLLGPVECLLAEQEEELQDWERLASGALPELEALQEHPARGLIQLRIALGVTHEELALSLRVPVEQVILAERNEHHGISLGEAETILHALISCFFTASSPGSQGLAQFYTVLVRCIELEDLIAQAHGHPSSLALLNAHHPGEIARHVDSPACR